MSKRYLCSHLIDVRLGDSSQSAILEQIEADKAVFGSETDYPINAAITIEAEGLAAPAQIVVTREREADFEIIVQFHSDYRWRLEDWTPDHLLEVTPRGKAAQAR